MGAWYPLIMHGKVTLFASAEIRCGKLKAIDTARGANPEAVSLFSIKTVLRQECLKYLSVNITTSDHFEMDEGDFSKAIFSLNIIACAVLEKDKKYNSMRRARSQYFEPRSLNLVYHKVITAAIFFTHFFLQIFGTCTYSGYRATPRN